MKKKIRNFLRFKISKIILFFFNKKIIHLLSKFELVRLEKNIFVNECKFCKNNNLKKIGYINLRKDFALFEKDNHNLEWIYLLNLPKIFFYWKFNTLRILVLEALWECINEKIKLYFLFCNKCKVFFQNYNDHEKNFKKHYSYYYRLNTNKTVYGRAKIKAHLDNYNEYIDMFEKYLKNKKILDVGCAEGTMINLIQKRGISKNCYGLEPSKQMCQFAKSESIQNIINSTYKKNLYEEGFFNLIICHHVFEHFENINSEIEKFYYHLSDDGELILSVPIVEEELKKINLNNNNLNLSKNHNFASDHINLFSKFFLINIFAKHNFQTVDIFENSRRHLASDLTIIFKKNNEV